MDHRDEAYGIVFSGGGALAAWEVGCYKTICSYHGGRSPKVVSGASAGALNAVGVSAKMPAQRIAELWTGITKAKVYSPRFGTGTLIRLFISSLARQSAFDAITEFLKR